MADVEVERAVLQRDDVLLTGRDGVELADLDGRVLADVDLRRILQSQDGLPVRFGDREGVVG
jgi:uncharacterized protein YjhX (UPF0386 family)